MSKQSSIPSSTSSSICDRGLEALAAVHHAMAHGGDLARGRRSRPCSGWVRAARSPARRRSCAPGSRPSPWAACRPRARSFTTAVPPMFSTRPFASARSVPACSWLRVGLDELELERRAAAVEDEDLHSSRSFLSGLPVLVVLEEAAPGLHAQVAGADHLAQQRAGAVLEVAQLVEQVLRPAHHLVEAHAVGECQRPDWAGRSPASSPCRRPRRVATPSITTCIASLRKGSITRVVT